MSTVRPGIDDSVRLRFLPFVLSLVAGSADELSFLGLGGLFVAHITGNLVLLAVQVVTGEHVALGPLPTALALAALLLAPKPNGQSADSAHGVGIGG
jgi:uncharacterized membrane protein YoaK (UPF0700 family)